MMIEQLSIANSRKVAFGGEAERQSRRRMGAPRKPLGNAGADS